MKKLNITSKFSHKILIQVNNVNNELLDANWQEFLHCFAQVKSVCDSKFISLEGVSFGNMITEEYFHFRMRYVKGIKKTMRILFNGKNFEIKRIIDEFEKGRMLSIIALKV